MANCDLSIELDDPERLRHGGETVRGVVHVRCESDVRCNGLSVRSLWETHGRGNVTSGETESKVLFTGDWQAGKPYHYRFELTAGHWPPTYHGHYLNVDHYIEARADVPWAFDPKTKAAFPLASSRGAVSPAKPTTRVHGCIGAVMVAVILSAVIAGGGMALLNPFFAVIVGIMALAAASWAIVFVWLPKYRLGRVEYELPQASLVPGDYLQGMLTVQPSSDVAVRGIHWTITAEEVCVSGSGSNRTTHKYTIFEHTEPVLATGTIRGGRQSRFPLHFELPPRPIYSLDLSDNDLIWSATLRIDIPRWPDWKQTERFQVVPPTMTPSDEAVASAPAATHGGRAPAAIPFDAAPLRGGSSGAPEPSSSSSPEAAAPTINFAETMQHFWNARENTPQIDPLVEAVQGISMPLEAIVERRLLYGSDDPLAYHNGYVVWAHYADPPMPLTLYIPGHLADEFEQMAGDRWQGEGVIVGYDRRHRRVQIQIEADDR